MLSTLRATLVSAGSLLAAQSPEPFQPLVQKHLAPFPPGVQMAVAVVQGEDVQFVGLRRTARGFEPVENRRGVFELGSLSKVFTATLLARAVARGELWLDQPVQPLLPIPLKTHGRDGVEITLGQLASHTSGIRDHQPPGLSRHAFFHGHRDDPYRCFDARAFETYLREDLALTSTPGTAYRYTNLGMSLLGRILADRAGVPFEALLRKELLDPLGMTRTTTDLGRAKADLVPGLRGKDEPAPFTPMNALTPCGGVLSTAEDMAVFAKAQFEPADPATRLAHHKVKDLEPGYGVALGWHLVERKNGQTWINHNGGMEACTTSLTLWPEGRCAVVVLCNYRNDETLGEEVRMLCRELLEAAIRARPR